MKYVAVFFFHLFAYKDDGSGSELIIEVWMAFRHLCGLCVLAQILVLIVLVSVVISPGMRFCFIFVNKARYTGVLPGSVAQK